MIRTPAECSSKDEIRAEIDRLDRALVGLFAERFGYVQRMAEIKGAPEDAVVPARIDEVLDRVGERAGEVGLDVGLARELWARLIDWNIEFERRTIASRLNAG